MLPQMDFLSPLWCTRLITMNVKGPILFVLCIGCVIAAEYALLAEIYADRRWAFVTLYSSLLIASLLLVRRLFQYCCKSLA